MRNSADCCSGHQLSVDELNAVSGGDKTMGQVARGVAWKLGLYGPCDPPPVPVVWTRPKEC
jgi:hypothetical protein